MRGQRHRLHTRFPLAAGTLTRPGGIVDRIAKAHGATSGQVALAWLLQHSPVILPIPGTLRVSHLEENVAAAALSLTPDEIGELDAGSWPADSTVANE